MKLRTKLTVIFLIVALISSIPIFLMSNVLLKESIKIFINPNVEKLIDKSLVNTKGKEESVVKLSEEYKKLRFIEVAVKRSVYVGSLLILLLVLIVAIIAGRIISKSITTPILCLLKGTKELYLGNVDYQIEEKSKIYEIEKLIKAFNNMIKRIKKGKEDLARSQKELVESEKKATWQIVAQKVAHEIKNPLTPIKLSMERILRKQKENNVEFKKVLEEDGKIILEEVEELYKLTQEFSEFAKLPKLNFEPYDINLILEEFIENQERLYPEVEFCQELSDNLPLVALDKSSIKRVFSNLIKNSSEAMYEGGMIFLKTKLNQDMVEIEVIDNGCGIREEDLPLVFEPHYSKKWGGMGLGLSIVKNIIEEHKGKIKLESKENRGTKFVISLPIWKGKDDV